MNFDFSSIDEIVEKHAERFVKLSREFNFCHFTSPLLLLLGKRRE